MDPYVHAMVLHIQRQYVFKLTRIRGPELYNNICQKCKCLFSGSSLCAADVVLACHHALMANVTCTRLGSAPVRNRAAIIQSAAHPTAPATIRAVGFDDKLPARQASYKPMVQILCPHS